MSKNYNDHKEEIAKFKRVLVTGPHGAGNKITAKIISHDIGAPYIRLEMPWSHTEYWDDNLGLKKQLDDIREENESYVLFTPSSSGHLHRILDYLQDTMVVFTYKDPTEIDEYTERNNYLRNIIIEASWVAIHKDSSLADYYSQSTERMKKAMAIIKVARKLISKLYCIWTKEEYYVNNVA